MGNHLSEHTGDLCGGGGRGKDGRGISQEEKVEEDAARRVGTKGGVVKGLR